MVMGDDDGEMDVEEGEEDGGIVVSQSEDEAIKRVKECRCS